MFGRDPNVLGRDIRLSGVPYRIVGVMPEGFSAPDRDSRLWVPFAFTRSSPPTMRATTIAGA